jgi:hypothetical protein
MGTNFHTALSGTSSWKPDHINPPFASLDQATTYLKNIIIHCDGIVVYNPLTGVLSWSSTLRILFVRSDGQAIQNTVAAGSVTLSDNEFAYVDLNETNDTVLTVSKAAVTTGAAANFKAYSRIVLGYRNTASDLYFPVYLHAERKGTVQTTDATVTTVDSVTLAEGKAYLVEVSVAAKEGDTNRAGYVRRACVYRPAAGSATLQGSVQDALTVESEAAWDCTIDVSGNDARVRVTGEAATTINWACKMIILEI